MIDVQLLPKNNDTRLLYFIIKDETILIGAFKQVYFMIEQNGKDCLK